MMLHSLNSCVQYAWCAWCCCWATLSTSPINVVISTQYDIKLLFDNILILSIRFVWTIHTHTQNRTRFVRANGQVANSFTFETQTHHIGMHSALIKINLMNKLWKCDIALVRAVCGINEWMNSNYYSWKDDENWVIESMNRMNECTNIAIFTSYSINFSFKFLELFQPNTILFSTLFNCIIKKRFQCFDDGFL